MYERYRPQNLDEVVGQPEAVKVLSKFVDAGDVPHAILFVGPTGTGKTTLARICAERVKCDLEEVNCATVEPLDTVRRIEKAIHHPPLFGKPIGFLLDEVQSLSRAGFAQQGLLKVLEPPAKGRDRPAGIPPWAYFFLATTDPIKVIATLRARCMEVRLRAVPDADLIALLNRIAKAEGKKLPAAVAARIASLAAGSARNAVMMLDEVIGLDEKTALAAVDRTGTESAAGIDLAKALLFQDPKWAEVSEIVLALIENGEEPEAVRRTILKVAQGTLLKNPSSAARAFRTIQLFRDPVYDSGFPALAAAAYEACMRAK